MSNILESARVCALALAVVLGMAAVSGAADNKTGPTGKTKQQCNDDYGVCLGSCVNAYSDCCDNVGSCASICDDGYSGCTDGCANAHENCYPAKGRPLQVLSKLSILVGGQKPILEGLTALSVKLDNMAAQVGAALPADLLPLSRNGTTDPLSFCQSPGANRLQVHVANQGSVAAPATTTHVDFANSGGVDMPTPGLAAGGSAIVEFAIPATCFDAHNRCSFTIIVDSTNAVIESNETNSAAGLCDAS